MRQIKEILRLRHQHQLSVREIARSSGLPSSTVSDYLNRTQRVGWSWPLPEHLNEEEIQRTLLQRSLAESPLPSEPTRPLPSWSHVHQELAQRGVTLRLLWQEYRQEHPEGYGYTQYCEYYKRWVKTLDPVLRQVHAPGEKMFVDWAGQSVAIHGSESGSQEAFLFVAVLGASNKTYVEAFENQKLAAWIAGHCHAYTFFEGVARVTVPDNPKTGVIRPCFYEPKIHRTYQEMAEHYGTVIIPARPKKPRDKAKVEAGVLIAERWILAALRHRTFFSTASLNQAIQPLLAQLNEQPFQKLEGSRNRWFEEQERAKLLPLPPSPYQLASWSRAGVNIDYHVAVDKHFYSVPYQLIHQTLEVRLTRTTVELFHQGKRVAAHQRSNQPGKFTTLEEHRPKSHQKYLQWTPSRIIQWAQHTGKDCAKLVEHIMQSRPHPEQGFRSSLGIIRLGKTFGQPRLEAACRRALHFGTCTYQSVKSILERRLDEQPLEPELPLHCPVHPNVRGPHYYS